MKDSEAKTSASAHQSHGAEPNLVRRTLRTVMLLVAACVIFVGTLSALAVAITSRAVNAGAPAAAEARAGDAKADSAKKPLSI